MPAADRRQPQRSEHPADRRAQPDRGADEGERDTDGGDTDGLPSFAWRGGFDVGCRQRLLRDEDPQQRVGDHAGAGQHAEQGEGGPHPGHRNVQMFGDAAGHAAQEGSPTGSHQARNTIGGARQIQLTTTSGGADLRPAAGRRIGLGHLAGSRVGGGAGSLGRPAGRTWGRRTHPLTVTRSATRRIGVHPGFVNQGHPRWCGRLRFGTLDA
jgi:hypothetical protein